MIMKKDNHPYIVQALSYMGAGAATLIGAVLLLCDVSDDFFLVPLIGWVFSIIIVKAVAIVIFAAEIWLMKKYYKAGSIDELDDILDKD